MICHVCQATGWSWDYVEDQLTVPRLRALKRYWAQSPPPRHLLALLVRTLLGSVNVAVPSRAPARDEPWQELAALAADPASGLAIRGKPPRR